MDKNSPKPSGDQSLTRFEGVLPRKSTRLKFVFPFILLQIPVSPAVVLTIPHIPDDHTRILCSTCFSLGGRKRGRPSFAS
ncbi:hypothetical protein BDR03DRAFT_960004 [Suillus americanus]|nr:hypothetical protein BDR03DRAFT_960004 [Suillus americanus]